MLVKCLEYFINVKGSGGFEVIDTFFLIYNLDTGHKGHKLSDQRIQNVEWIDCNDDEDYSDGSDDIGSCIEKWQKQPKDTCYFDKFFSQGCPILTRIFISY